MKYRTLGRTDLKVSRVGLGSGGPSQFGQSTGVSEPEIHRLVRTALDLGVNLIDTATGYGESEAILGRALRGVPRDRYYIATKTRPERNGTTLSEKALVEQVERSLQRLQIETIDIFQFHGVRPHEYSGAMENLLPVAEKLKAQGKVRFIGASEMFFDDGKHEMFQRALNKDDPFDTVMVGYNLLNQGAERTVFPLCREKNVGVLIMIAVRKALSVPERLRQVIADLKSRGVIPPDALPDVHPLGWLVGAHVESVTAAAYKFVAAQPAVSTVFTGTANIDHLRANVDAILGPPLPDADMQRLREVFGHIDESLGN
ncbi:MAG: aldo/keto reductase [Candidatus Poribacteria bacterium]|nr:aldo/keto reductase [Candidatus Poribacteria bacterium]